MRFKEVANSFSFRLAALSGFGFLVLAVIAGYFINDRLYDDRIYLVRTQVETAISIVADYHKRASWGEFSQEQAQALAKERIRAIRFADFQYLFVLDLKGILLVHGANPALEGNNTGHETDSKGLDFPQAMIAKAKEGGGHVYYEWPRPGASVPSRKVCYSMLYEPWGWVINAGIFVDDIALTFWRVIRAFALIAGSVMLVVTVMAYFASKQLLAAMDGRRRAEKEALQASRLAGMGQLAAGLAHEINTPAQYVGDNLRYLEEELADLLKSLKAGSLPSMQAITQWAEDLPAALQEGREGVAHISKIVQSMKDFAKPGSVETSELDVNKAIDSTLTVSHSAWRGIADIECRLAPSLPSVPCLASEISQVFLSLILNAVEAIARSGKKLPGHILIETFDEQDTVVVRISDTGQGVPENLRERIFDPFFTTKPVGQGIGQGLAISRDVVEIKHGGRIEVGGIVGEGAVFTLRLPRNGVTRRQ